MFSRTPTAKGNLMADVKHALAKGVQDMLMKNVPLDRSAVIPELEFGGAEIEPQAVSKLETVIRVKTRTQGVRYFVIKVSEMTG